MKPPKKYCSEKGIQPLKAIKADSQKFFARQPSEIDAGIKEVLVKINQLPCVVKTIESCSAHFKYATKLPSKIERIVKHYFTIVHAYFTNWTWNPKKLVQYLQPEYVITYVNLVNGKIYDSELEEILEEDDFQALLQSRNFLDLVKDEIRMDSKPPYYPEISRLAEMVKNEETAFTDLANSPESDVFLMVSLINDHPLTPKFHQYMVAACGKYRGSYDFLSLEDLIDHVLEAIGDPKAKCTCGCGRFIFMCDVECETHQGRPYNQCPCPKQEIAAENLVKIAQCVVRQTDVRYHIPMKNAQAAKNFWQQLEKFVDKL